jgi:hypothetical protein
MHDPMGVGQDVRRCTIDHVGAMLPSIKER